MRKIRTLTAQDIEVRPADRAKNGQKVHMLLYINSRSATNLLDETYGAENYNIEYVDVAGQIYCRLSVWDEEKERYVVRMDTGEEAKISADKSLASDALKRTIVRLGVTELYSGPSIYVDDDGYGNSGYSVKEISYDGNRNIIHLVINNKFGKEVYRWDEGIKTELTTNYTSESENMKENRIDQLKSFCHDLKENGEDTNIVLKFYNYYTKPDKDNPDKTIIETRRFFNLDSMWSKWKNG